LHKRPLHFYLAIANLAELDGPDPFEKSLGPDGWSYFWPTHNGALRVLEPSCLLNGRSQHRSKPVMCQVRHACDNHVAPGRTSEFEKNAKEMQGAMAKPMPKHTSLARWFRRKSKHTLPLSRLRLCRSRCFWPVVCKSHGRGNILPQSGVITNILYEVYTAIPS